VLNLGGGKERKERIENNIRNAFNKILPIIANGNGIEKRVGFVFLSMLWDAKMRIGTWWEIKW
jgi:hypothetical protein